MIKSNSSITNVWLWFWGYGKRRVLYILAIIMAIALVTGTNLLRAKVLDRLITTALAQETSRLPSIFFSLFFIVSAGLVGNSLLLFFKTGFGASIAGYLRVDFLDSLLKAPISELQKVSSGRVISIYNNELAKITRLLSGQFVDALFQPIMFVAASVYMIFINWKLYIISYALLPFISIILNKIFKKSASYSAPYYEKIGYANQLSKECIDGIVEVKTFSMEKTMAQRCRSAFDDVLFYILKSEKWDALSLPFWVLNVELPKIMCILFGGLFALRGEITVGQLVAYIQLNLYVTQPASVILALVGALKQASAALDSLKVVMELKESEEISIKSLNSLSKEGIVFDNVSFAYGDNQVLSDCSFTIGKKGFYVLAGASGQGKSTILDLICGLYTINKGKIALREEFLRDGIAYVPQDSVLFSGTIADNIGIGVENPDLSLIKEAAISAGAHDFISGLPQGYNTPVGERGHTLSGGQRQRIAIARAFFKKSPLVIMDEPTASLDEDAEGKLVNILKQLSMDATLVVCSHRLSTISKADKIFVLSLGKIVQEGSHNLLWSQKDGTYYKLYKEQLESKEGDVAV